MQDRYKSTVKAIEERIADLCYRLNTGNPIKLESSDSKKVTCSRQVSKFYQASLSKKTLYGTISDENKFSDATSLSEAFALSESSIFDVNSSILLDQVKKTDSDLESSHFSPQKFSKIFFYGHYTYECKQCDANGYVRCVSCYGNGQLLCITCSGLKKVRCYSCNGTGRNEVGNQWCVECYGTGYANCRTCFGDGAISCSYCAGRGYTMCEHCSGHGVFSEQWTGKLESHTTVNYKSPGSVLEDKFGSSYQSFYAKSLAHLSKKFITSNIHGQYKVGKDFFEINTESEFETTLRNLTYSTKEKNTISVDFIDESEIIDFKNSFDFYLERITYDIKSSNTRAGLFKKEPYESLLEQKKEDNKSYLRYFNCVSSSAVDDFYSAVDEHASKISKETPLQLKATILSFLLNSTLLLLPFILSATSPILENHLATDTFLGLFSRHLELNLSDSGFIAYILIAIYLLLATTAIKSIHIRIIKPKLIRRLYWLFVLSFYNVSFSVFLIYTSSLEFNVNHDHFELFIQLIKHNFNMVFWYTALLLSIFISSALGQHEIQKSVNIKKFGGSSLFNYLNREK